MEKLICCSCGASDFDEVRWGRMKCTFCHTEFTTNLSTTNISRTDTSAIISYGYTASRLCVPSDYGHDYSQHLPVSVIKTATDDSKKGLFSRIFG